MLDLLYTSKDFLQVMNSAVKFPEKSKVQKGAVRAAVLGPGMHPPVLTECHSASQYDG